MKKSYIVKIDYKNGELRLDLYKAHSIRISGRCKVEFSMDSTSAVTRNKIDELIMQMDKEFDIGFKANVIKNIRSWFKVNVSVLHVRNDIDDDIAFDIQKLSGDKCILIRD